jgi:hypothetical protein
MKTDYSCSARLAALCIASLALLLGGASSGRSQGIITATTQEELTPELMMERIKTLQRIVKGPVSANSAVEDFADRVWNTQKLAKEGKLTAEQSVQRVRSAADIFRRESKLVWLKVVAQPDGCTRRWKPLFGGSWTGIIGDGAFIGIGTNLVSVSKPNYKTVTDRIEISTDSTATYNLTLEAP